MSRYAAIATAPDMFAYRLGRITTPESLERLLTMRNNEATDKLRRENETLRIQLVVANALAIKPETFVYQPPT